MPHIMIVSACYTNRIFINITYQSIEQGMMNELPDTFLGILLSSSSSRANGIK